MTIEFNTYLKSEDWMPAVGGWRCDALLIPGAKFEALYHDGAKADPKDFTVERHIIRWSGSTHPKDLLVTLSLEKELHKLEQEKIRLEQEKFNLENKRVSVENKWKAITAIGAVLSSLLTVGATYLSNWPVAEVSKNRPDIHTYSRRLNITGAECLSLVSQSFTNYGLTRINSVRGGVYGEKGSYNVFVSCDDSLDIISLVVSGSERSIAKSIRDDLKTQLP